MTLCASCALDTASGFCVHHVSWAPDDWAAGNKVWCDWLHRGIEPVRVPPDDRALDMSVYGYLTADA